MIARQPSIANTPLPKITPWIDNSHLLG